VIVVKDKRKTLTNQELIAAAEDIVQTANYILDTLLSMREVEPKESPGSVEDD